MLYIGGVIYLATSFALKGYSFQARDCVNFDTKKKKVSKQEKVKDYP